MKKIISYKTASGADILIQIPKTESINTDYAGMRDVSMISDKAEEVISVVEKSLESSLKSICVFSEIVTEKLKELKPQKMEVEFGVIFSAEVGAVITSVGAEANLKITLSWETIQ